MNVLTITSCYPVAHSPSDGIFVRSQCEALTSIGVDVRVFSPRPWTPPGFQCLSNKWNAYAKTPTFYLLNGIPVHRPRYIAPPRAELWMPVHWQYVRAAKMLGAKPDIIHAHFSYPGGVAGMMLARQWNIPFVVTLHGDEVNVFAERYLRFRHALLSVVENADLTIAVSGALADRTEHIVGKRPTVAPIGINLRLFSPSVTKSDARRILGLPQDKFVILNLGRLVQEKGVSELVKAVGPLGQSKCLTLFVGLGPLASSIRGESGTEVIGVQPNERVPLFLRAADVFILPSYSEGMPTVLVEAGAVGVPVIATTVGGIPELLDKERGWLIPPKDPKALECALKEVMSNPGEAARRAARLQDYVKQGYDVLSCARWLKTVYAGCLSRSN